MKMIFKYGDDLEVKEEGLKQRIKHKANKLGYKTGSCLIRYNGFLYYVDFNKDRIVAQLEYK